MATRALIRINIKQDEIVTPLVCIYKQSDGYLSGLGATLYEFISRKKIVSNLGATLYEFISRKKIVNGIGRDRDPVNISNGAYDFAGQLVYELKERQPLGGVYLYPMDTGDAGQDFTYTVTFVQTTSYDGIDVLDSVSIECQGDEAVFTGENLLSELKAHIEKDE